MKTPLDRARDAHRTARTTAALDQRVVAALRAPRGPTPRFPAWWVPALTTPAVLLLWFLLHDPLPPMRSASPAPAPTPGFVVADAAPDAPQTWSVSRPLPEPQANHVTLWGPGETGLQSLLDEAMSYGVASGVQVSLRSSFATLDKRAEQHVVMLAGHLDWNVRYLETSELTVEALGVVFEVTPGRFSLEVGRHQVTLEVEAGQVVVRAPREPARIVSAQGRWTSRVAPGPSPNRPSWTREELERRLEAFAKAGQHDRAAAFIREVLPQVGGALRESLLVDLAAIYGQHLHDWDLACDTLAWAVREFPGGALSEGISHLRDRYRCP
jgi:hypothetical protein